MRPRVILLGDDVFPRRHAIWEAGGVALQPLPTPGFEQFWLDDALLLIRDADAVFLPDTWRHFAASAQAYAEARSWGVRVFTSLVELCTWLAQGDERERLAALEDHARDVAGTFFDR